MKILVTGTAGQLGRELVPILQAAGEEVVGIDQQELDLSRTDEVASGIANYGVDWVINCAAYTQVDKAEEDRELAFLINRDSAGAVAIGVKRCRGRLVHISTDFIFDGKQSRPYKEDDVANPLGVYGQSKLEGEQLVHKVMPEAIILRTAWVYGIHGHNFVKTMLRLAAEREELNVVDDQIGTPSWTADIASAIQTLIDRNAAGTYHFTNEGVASWYDFADSIVHIARDLGFPIKAKIVKPIPSSEFPTPATRPPYSVLNKQKIRNLLDRDIPHWQQSLEQMLRQLQGNAE
jgi:dTDP-4-dehydrorhamnose reductase